VKLVTSVWRNTWIKQKTSQKDNYYKIPKDLNMGCSPKIVWWWENVTMTAQVGSLVSFNEEQV